MIAVQVVRTVQSQIVIIMHYVGGLILMVYPIGGNFPAMRPLCYSINVTLDGCVDHRAGSTDEELHRFWAENFRRPMPCSSAGSLTK